ncbi:MAG: exodeoxyribonuclease VII large subunit [Cellvibrionaceae bacterium]|nr:exodeoxyribonuclease VII large subunit [Cellvibrionaceae bacterium]
METPTIPASSTERKVISVSELNKRVKGLLEIHLPLIWVEGEISNLSCPRSGHWYFTLKDERAQVRSAMFRNRNQLLREKPNEGDKVMLRARVSLYEGRGDFQLIVEHMEAAGIGRLQEQFSALKRKLEAEGLFDAAHKKPFPTFPKHLAVVTSPTGAALQDVLTVLRKRFPALPVTIVPSTVQGEQAPAALIRALQLADRAERFDSIILCRGGGSIEDLSAFNNEDLARTIFAAQTPLVSAVGHEVDFTIADFVADYRAPTPSAAAEFISPDQEELLSGFRGYEQALQKNLIQLLAAQQQKLKYLRARLKHPGDKLQQWSQQLDHLDIRLNLAATLRLHAKLNQMQQLRQKIYRFAPHHQIARAQQQLSTAEKRLQSIMHEKLNTTAMRLAKSAEALHIVSPLATLARGYAIVKNHQGEIIRQAEHLNNGDNVTVTLAHGGFSAQVTESQPDSEDIL